MNSYDDRSQVRPRPLLLIEDSRSDARLIALTLAHDDVGRCFAVSTAQSLGDGITLAQQQVFDIVLLDLALPDSIGLATFQALDAALERRVPIVILTSSGFDELAEQAVALGAQEYLYKDRLDSFWVTRALVHAIGRHELARRLHAAEARELLVAQSASQAKSDYLAMMTHELRTPLSAIATASSLALAQARETPKDVRELVETIQRTGEHLIHLLGNSLDLSKIEAGKLEIETAEVDFNVLVSETLSIYLALSAERGIELRVFIDTGAPDRLRTDPTRFRQMVSNLLGNALKFTPRGGHVTVRVSVEKADELAGDSLKITFRDDGSGIAAEQREHLFEPYRQADPSIARCYGGTGLGLVISRKLAQALGGSLELEWSEPGQGSQFALILPVSRSEVRPAALMSEPPRASETVACALCLAGRRILLVDDSTDLRMLYGRIIGGAGAIVDGAGDGADAVRMAREGAYDAIVMDLKMPGLDGDVAAAQIRAAGIPAPILMLTGSTRPEDAARGHAAGCDAVLIKQDATRNLTGAIAALLDCAKTRRPPRLAVCTEAFTT